MSDSFAKLNRQIVACTKCPRLIGHCITVGREKRRAFADQTYWARPVTGFGDTNARIWIVGLAPGAHGANRTGRIFTGDKSGDFLYAALHRAGLANQPTSISASDGLKLRDVYISAAGRCAPPGNKPTLEELSNCQPFLEREWELLRHKRVILALGGIAWNAVLKLAGARGLAFAHGAELALDGATLLGSYHVSQQNTFTGRLTPAMFDKILIRAVMNASIRPSG